MGLALGEGRRATRVLDHSCEERVEKEEGYLEARHRARSSLAAATGRWKKQRAYDSGCAALISRTFHVSLVAGQLKYAVSDAIV